MLNLGINHLFNLNFYHIAFNFLFNYLFLNFVVDIETIFIKIRFKITFIYYIYFY